MAIKVGESILLRPGVRRVTAPNAGIMTGPGTNTYLVGEHEVAVIDTGVDNPAHLDAIEAAAPGPIKWILITHGHPDHTGGARELADRTGAPVYAHPYRLQGIRDEAFFADRYLDEGDVVNGVGFAIRCLHTTGHAADHLCYLHEQSGLLFAGDHVMEAVTVVIAPPDGDMAAYLDSLHRLADEPVTAIAPAHGELMPEPKAVFEQIVDHRLMREQQVLALLGEGEQRIRDMVPTLYPELPAVVQRVAEWQIHAHLLKLQGEGRVAGAATDGLWRAC